ncbi:MAG: hypothetical protein ACHQ9S_13735 [Candidatus Binatia bacterium]
MDRLRGAGEVARVSRLVFDVENLSRFEGISERDLDAYLVDCHGQFLLASVLTPLSNVRAYERLGKTLSPGAARGMHRLAAAGMRKYAGWLHNMSVTKVAEAQRSMRSLRDEVLQYDRLATEVEQITAGAVLPASIEGLESVAAFADAQRPSLNERTKDDHN